MAVSRFASGLASVFVMSVGLSFFFEPVAFASDVDDGGSMQQPGVAPI